jgi:hypothetical protein
MTLERVPRSLSDDELIARLAQLVSQARRVEADVVAHIGEVDERRLYARFAFPSMFAYCTQELHLSEAGAYRRIAVARAARQHPMLLAMLRDGRLHLGSIAALVSVLTVENRDLVLARAIHRSKRDVEALVAELSPRPDVASSNRKLPTRPMPDPAPRPVATVALATPLVEAGPRLDAELSPGRVDPAQPRARKVMTLSPARYKVQFTASAELRDKLERLTALMRSETPDGDLAKIIERLVTEKLARIDARRFARTTAPRRTLQDSRFEPVTRHIPAAMRRAVHERDGGRCRYRDEHGRQCTERQRLEFHHRHPFGLGGDHSVDNLSLLCPAHNRHIAAQDYGRSAIDRRPTASEH